MSDIEKCLVSFYRGEGGVGVGHWYTQEVAFQDKGSNRFDGAASFLFPLMAAQFKGAVDVGLSVIRAQDKQSGAHKDKTKGKNNISQTLIRL